MMTDGPPDASILGQPTSGRITHAFEKIVTKPGIYVKNLGIYYAYTEN